MVDTDVVEQSSGGSEEQGWIDVSKKYACGCGNSQDFYYLEDGFSKEVHFRQSGNGGPDILNTLYRPTRPSLTYVICGKCYELLDKIQEKSMRLGLTAEL